MGSYRIRVGEDSHVLNVDEPNSDKKRGDSTPAPPDDGDIGEVPPLVGLS